MLFKTHGAGFEALVRQVRHLKLPPVPITCLGCEGLRYDAGTYTIAFYRGKPTAYPFVVLLHPKNPPPAPAAAARAPEVGRGPRP